MIELPENDRDAVLAIEQHIGQKYNWHFTREEADYVVNEVATLVNTRPLVAVSVLNLFFNYWLEQPESKGYLPPSSLCKFQPFVCANNKYGKGGTSTRIHVMGEDAYKNHESVRKVLATRIHKNYHCDLCKKAIEGESYE